MLSPRPATFSFAVGSVAPLGKLGTPLPASLMHDDKALQFTGTLYFPSSPGKGESPSPQQAASLPALSSLGRDHVISFCVPSSVFLLIDLYWNYLGIFKKKYWYMAPIPVGSFPRLSVLLSIAATISKMGSCSCILYYVLSTILSPFHVHACVNQWVLTLPLWDRLCEYPRYISGNRSI